MSSKAIKGFDCSLPDLYRRFFLILLIRQAYLPVQAFDQAPKKSSAQKAAEAAARKAAANAAAANSLSLEEVQALLVSKH